ncbi:MAG: hypothetical protein WEB06_13080 [Actinomycetota bacterium]
MRAAAAVVALIGASSSVVAYIDAGSGSYIFQLVVGTLVGGAVAVKVFWRRVSAFFVGKLFRSGGHHAAGPR